MCSKRARCIEASGDGKKDGLSHREGDDSVCMTVHYFLLKASACLLFLHWGAPIACNSWPLILHKRMCAEWVELSIPDKGNRGNGAAGLNQIILDTDLWKNERCRSLNISLGEAAAKASAREQMKGGECRHAETQGTRGMKRVQKRAEGI